MLARIGPAWARRRSRPSERCALKDHMPARRHGERLPMAFLDLGVGDGWDHRSQQVAGCSPRRLYRPCRARPADRSLVAEDRSAGGVRDRTGPDPAVLTRLLTGRAATPRDERVQDGTTLRQP